MTAAQLHDAPDDLRRISAELGQNPDLVQGAGGNTSIKRDGLLWIKASGKWLAEAQGPGCFVPLDQQRLLRGLTSGAEDPAADAVRSDLALRGLRPSVETTLHAVLPQACVLHVHSVSTIAWAVHPEGSQRLAERLQGLRWHWIPYVRPGLPLTHAVTAALEQAPAEVLVMANHGLVVAGETVAEALALLQEVEGRISATGIGADLGHRLQNTRACLLVALLQCLFERGQSVLADLRQSVGVRIRGGLTAGLG